MINQLRNAIDACSHTISLFVRRLRGLAPIAVVLVLTLAIAAVFGMMALARGSDQPAASPVIIARADFHSETPYNGKDLEMNVALSQVGSDCQVTTLGTGYCLRYTVVLDEKPVIVGYGVIPASAVHVTATSIVLTVDTSKVAKFVHVVGTGTPVSISWAFASTTGKSPSAMINKPQKASALGGVSTYTVPASAVIATILYK